MDQATATARIAVTVTDFQSCCSKARIQLTHAEDRSVSQERENGPIEVYASVYLEFSVESGDGKYSFLPIGIAFRNVSGAEATKQPADCNEGSRRDPLGNAAFPERKIVAKADTVKLMLFDANPEPAEFEFSLVIQRSDGLLSVVDPRIRNRGVQV